MEPLRRPVRAAVAAAMACAVVFAALTWYVVAHAPTTRLDRRAQGFALGHRGPWLNGMLETCTRLGSTLVLVPVLLLASALVWRSRRDPYAVASLWVAFLGAMVLYQVFKTLVGRARPPVPQMLMHAGGYAYPSGHATQAITVWGLLAFLASTDPRRRAPRALILGAATVVVVLVGVSRVYLGVHWVTDVAGGYALGAAWLALVCAFLSRGQSGTERSRRTRPLTGSTERGAGPR